MTSFQPFPFSPTNPNPTSDRLCTGGDDLDCRIEGADFTTEPAPAKNEITIAAYNLERGHHARRQLRALGREPDCPTPDILLLSEADRGCSRTSYRNIAREYARELGMCYVYGTEFVELPRVFGPGGPVWRRCEHGNAIVSRYPLGNVRLIRHQHARSWNSKLQRILHVGEPRLGGRVAVAADAKIGDKLLRLYAVHFESGNSRNGWRTADSYRESQVKELIADADAIDNGVIIGGDMNVGRYLGLLKEDTSAEPVTAALFDSDYQDAHSSLDPADRITTDSGVAIDLIFGRNVAFSEPGIGARETWGDLSNHLPVWTQVRL